MRKAPLGVLISVAVHTALGALVFAAYEPPARPEPEAEPVTVEIVPIEPAPMEVAVAAPTAPMPVPEPARPPPPPPPERRAAPPAPPSISTGTARPIETAPVDPGTPDPSATPPRRSAWFDLRGGRRPTVDLRLPSGHRDDLERVPRGTDAAPGVAPTGQLQDAGGGSRRSDQGVFTAKVAPDGSVTLKDGRNLRVGLALPTPRSIGNGVSRWYYSDKGPDGQRGERALEKEVSGSTDAGDRSKTAIVPVVRGGFDVTDALMRSKGQDPYASKKLAFLDSTRDERVAMGNAHREQQLKKTTQIVQRNLDQLWQRVTDPRARREALFELWDEVVESGDEATVEAGRAARRLVVGVIRARLPAGGPDAYTAEELAALNRRRHSKATFAPYE
ncbi:MAG TPA: hypothetical protein VNO30_12495 [Kofleriaceae bacterium]|nr:hypothetical protein [Kofleriaceae bacterium]